MEQDLYEVLGVSRAATEEDVKAAFERVRDDAPPEVVQAYEVLRHRRRRLLYDTFGLGRWRRAAEKRDLPTVAVALEWYEAERGLTRRVSFAEPAVCSTCTGSGFEIARAEQCERCGGSGHLDPPADDPDAEEHVMDVTTCLACGGRGTRTARRPCAACSGTGASVTRRTVELVVPPGVRNGDELRVEGVVRGFRMDVTPRPRDSRLVLAVSALALACAVGLLVYLLVR
jgi:DnaJ-class molecular chaperone